MNKKFDQLKHIFSMLLFCVVLTPSILSAKTLSDYLSDIAIYVLAVPTGNNASEAADIYKEIISKYNFTVESKSKPGGPAFGWKPGSKGLFGTNPHIMIAYGITEKKEQETIASIVREYRTSQKITYPVELQFYKEENWRTWTSADRKSSGGSRGSEELIRKITVKE